MNPVPGRTPHITSVHMGLGAFFRAHQAWYASIAGDAGIHAFTGRTPGSALALNQQDCVYTLVARGDHDDATVIESVVAASDGGDRQAWLAAISSPDVTVCTMTVTEAGYSWSESEVLPLQSNEGGSSPVARLVDGLAARRRSAGTGLTVVPCDNLPANGRVISDATLKLAERVDADLAAWILEEVTFVSTVVDRITPATTDADRDAMEQLTGWRDRHPVVTEPQSSWILAGRFPNGRPAWEKGGAEFVDDIAPYERRKLWLLNAAHTSLSLQGPPRGHATVAEAMKDSVCEDQIRRLWTEAADVLPFDDEEISEATSTLVDRFTNARIEHRLDQIAQGVHLKLGPRIVDPLKARLAAGLAPGEAQLDVLAQWWAGLPDTDESQPADVAAHDLLQRLDAALTSNELLLSPLSAAVTKARRPREDTTS